MTKPRIAAIIAAATLGAAAFTGASIAVASDGIPAQRSAADDSHSGPRAGTAGPHGPGEHGERGPERHGERGPGQHGPGSQGHGREFLHSEGVIEDAEGNFVTVRMQSGEVTAVSADSLSVKSADGYVSTYTIGDRTVVERDGADGAPTVGDSVHVRATVDGSTATADHIHALSPEKAQELEDHRAQMREWMSERPESPARA